MDGVKKANEGDRRRGDSAALDQLTAAQHKAAESLYKQGGGRAAPAVRAGRRRRGRRGAASGGGGGESKGDVIDAEVVDEGQTKLEVRSDEVRSES